MPYYRTNVFIEDDVPDLEGAEYASLDAAKLKAFTGARRLLAERIMKGQALNLAHRIEHAGETGDVLHTLAFGDVVDIRQR